MSLTQQQAAALLVIRARLDPSHPGFSASDEVRAHLEGCRGYLEAWVLSYIDFLEGSSWHGRAAHIKAEADRIRARAAAAELR
jgi:hypothetical protein